MIPRSSFRGGASVSTIDDRRTALSTGVSVALKKGLWEKFKEVVGGWSMMPMSC